MAEPDTVGEELDPCAEDLIESLRAFGYDLPTALADLVDNSIAAGAGRVVVAYCSDPGESWVAVVDDGDGMTEELLREAMRFARNPNHRREAGDLGRFGLGLKTASLSQARRLTVVTRTGAGESSSRTWDIDHVREHRRWLALTGLDEEAQRIVSQLGFDGRGTVVLWRKLDRLGEGPALSRRMVEAGRELSLLFHRFIENGKLRILLGGRELTPMDPYLRRHTATQDRGLEVLEHAGHRVRVNPVILPHPSRLSEQERRLSTGQGGMLGRQGFYIYRGNRLVVAGGWLGLGGLHSSAPTRLARVAVEIPPGADLDWDVDVRKSSVRPPVELERRIIELATDARTRSERVFTHRGAPNRSGGGRSEVRPVWQQVRRLGETGYLINREHPVVANALSGEAGVALEAVLRLVESTLPVQNILHEAALGQRPGASAVEPEPTESIEEVLTAFREMLAGLPQERSVRSALVETIARSEPFSRYPGLIKEVIESDTSEEL